MDRIDFLGFVLLLRDISRLDRYSTRHSIPNSSRTGSAPSRRRAGTIRWRNSSASLSRTN